MAMMNWTRSVITTPQKPDSTVYTSHGIEIDEHTHDLHHGEDDPAHDDAVEDHTFPHAAEPPQNLSWSTGVTERHQLDVGNHARAAPQPGKEKGGHEVGRGEVPHHPNAGDAVRGHESRHGERGIRGEHGGDDGCAYQPPREVPPRQEVVGDAAPRPAPEEQTYGKCEEQVC
jgi:hypothetical protein